LIINANKMEGKKKGKSMLLQDIPTDVYDKIISTQAKEMIRSKKKPNQQQVVFTMIRAFFSESK
jgi:hypothetical protein